MTYRSGPWRRTNTLGRRRALAAALAILGSIAVGEEIRLKPEVRLPPGRVRLGDTAEIIVANPELADRLRQIEIGVTPPTGTVWLRAREIRQAVERHLGVDGGPAGRGLRWSGAAAIRVEVGVATASPSERELPAETKSWPAILERLVRDRMSADGYPGAESADVEVRADGLLTHLERRPARRIELEPPVSWRGGLNRIRFLVPDEAGERVFPAEALVVTVGTALVPIRDLRRGEVLTDADLKLVRHERRDARRELLADAEQAVGRRVERAVKAGEPLAATDVKAVPVVFRGEPVTVKVMKGSLLLMELPGRALVDGAAGEWVEVANATTKRPMLTRARVLEPGVVELGDGAPPSKLAQPARKSNAIAAPLQRERTRSVGSEREQGQREERGP